MVRRFKKNERSLHKRAAQKKRAFWQHVPSPSWKKTSVWEHKADLWCGPKRYFFQKKKSLFFRENFFHTVNALVSKKMSKKAVMLVFLGPKRSWEFFWVFIKKSEKSHFLRFFWKNAYGLRHILITCRITIWHKKLVFFLVEKKCQKKRVFVFWNFFLKMKTGHLFLSIFEIIKKVLKTLNFPFSPSRWIIFGEMERNISHFLPMFCRCFVDLNLEDDAFMNILSNLSGNECINLL